MSITDRIENDGMTPRDAAMKESLTVSEAPASTLLQRLCSEAADAAACAEHCELEVARPAFASISALLYEAAERIEAQDKRFTEHFDAWKANSAFHAQRIADLQAALHDALNLIDHDDYDVSRLIEVRDRK